MTQGLTAGKASDSLAPSGPFKRDSLAATIQALHVCELIYEIAMHGDTAVKPSFWVVMLGFMCFDL